MRNIDRLRKMSLYEIAPYLVTRCVEDNSYYDFKGDYIPEYRAFWTSPKQMNREFHDDALQDCLEWLDEEYVNEDV